MSRQNFKQLLFEQFARIGKAMANGHRLELLEYLAQGERSVEALAEVARLTVANASQHLQQLRKAGLVSTRREGQRVYYQLSDSTVSELLSAMEKIAEQRLGEVDRLVRSYLSTKDGLEPITRDDLRKRVAEGKATVLDVRPPEEFRAGHVPGALNVPIRELEAQLERLPRHQEVVAYCRGPYCVLAFEAVARLRHLGYQARRMEDGFPEWKSAGLPVEQGNRYTDGS